MIDRFTDWTLDLPHPVGVTVFITGIVGGATLVVFSIVAISVLISSGGTVGFITQSILGVVIAYISFFIFRCWFIALRTLWQKDDGHE